MNALLNNIHTKLKTGLTLLSRFTRSFFFLSTILVGLLSLLTWFWGAQAKISGYAPFGPTLNRLITIGVLLFLWIIGNIIHARQAAKRKPKFNIPQSMPLIDPVNEELEQLRTSFKNAMKAIREKWTGKERGQKTLYSLPWYLVLGAQGVGKTSLIVDADLKFPLGHVLGQDNFKSIKVSNLPNYWVTNESVLFDLPGYWLRREENTTDQKQSREERLWRCFMGLLVDHRPRRPINGVVLCLDIVNIIRADDEERGNQAANIHARLVELAESLGTRFTVHIIFTKLDRLSGFRDFFSQLSKTERNAPFGFSFPIFDEINSDDWVEEFEKYFASFMARANDEMLDRLYTQREVQSRRNTYVFSREFAAAGPILIDFLKHALHSDRFSTPPMVRGAYFTSTKQEGVPFNALLARIAREYHMSAPIMPAYSGHSAQYFSPQIFHNVIFKESGLAGDNRAVERRKRMVLNGTVLASVLSVLGLWFFLHQAMGNNSSRANNVVAQTKDFIAMPKELTDSKQAAQLAQPLNAIRAATDEFPGWRDAYYLQRFTSLYQGRKIGPEVEEVYKGLLNTRFLPAIANNLANEIDRLGAQPATAESNERLEKLRTYLLMGDKNRRLEMDMRLNASGTPSMMGTATILDALNKDWQRDFEGNKPLQNSLNTHLTHALNTLSLSSPIEQTIVQKAQKDLRAIPRDLRLYRGIETLAARQFPNGVSFRNEIGPSFDLVFKQGTEMGTKAKDISIPAFFTKPNFLEFFIPQNEALSILAVEDAWVAGEREKISYSQEDLETFRSKVRHRYATSYIDSWHSSINALEIIDFASIDHAVAILEEINGPANPLGRMLALVKVNTEIYEQKPMTVDKSKPSATNASALTFDDNREQGLRIARAFARLNQSITAKDKERPLYEELSGALMRLEAYMREIKSGLASSKPLALERARARANLQGDDPIYILRRIGANLPEPLNKHFNKIADECWKVILQSAKKNLQTLWQQKIYRHYNVQLATRYPFRREAKDDVSIEEFEAFFSPTGIFEGFFKEFLTTFINENTGKPIIIDGQSIQVSNQFLDEIKKVRHVRNLFFDGKGAPSLKYSIEPVSLSQGVARAVLNIEGQLVPYSHGPTRPISILWPNALSSQQNISQLSAFGGEATAALTFQGLWSSFRLMDKARVSNVKAESVDVTFEMGRSRALYRIRATTPENPFTTQYLTKLKLPETL